METELLNTLEIKKSLHKFIMETDDINVLKNVENYFLSLNNEEEWWESLSEDEKQQVNIGISQLDNGESVSYEQVKKKADLLFGRHE